MTMHRSRPAVLATLVVGIVVDSSTPAAHAGCTTRDEARAVIRSLEHTLQCSYRQLRSGPEVRCNDVPAPPPLGARLDSNSRVVSPRDIAK